MDEVCGLGLINFCIRCQIKHIEYRAVGTFTFHNVIIFGSGVVS